MDSCGGPPPGLAPLKVPDPAPDGADAAPLLPPRGGSSWGGAAAAPPLSPVSQMFLGMGDSTPDIYAILRLQGHATLEDIAPAMQHLADVHDRFRARVRCRNGVYYTEMLENFDARCCMRQVELEGDDIDEAFNKYVSELMSGPRLANGPLPAWDCSVIHFASDWHHTDVLLRCSHMIGDGQLFLQLLRDVLLDVEEDPGPCCGGSSDGEDAASTRSESDASSVASRGASVGGSSSVSSFTSCGSAGGSSAGGGASAGGGGGGSAGGASGSAGSGGLSARARLGGKAGGSPLLIRAVHNQQSAFLPPPSIEREQRERERQRQRQERARAAAAAAAEGGGGRGYSACAKAGLAAARRLGRRAWKHLLALWSWITSAMFITSMPIRIPDPVNAIKAAPDEMGGPRAFSSVVLPLDEMRHVSKVLSVTINTLAVSCLAGGVRRYLLDNGGGGRRLSLLPWRRAKERAARAAGGAAALASTIPESVMLCCIVDTRSMRRSKAAATAAGGAGGAAAAAASAPAAAAGGYNTLSFIGVPVATGDAPPLARLASVARSLEWVRGSLAVLIAVLIPPITQFFVRDMALATRIIMWLLPHKTTLGFSNMRGPVKRVQLCGYPVERMYNGVQPSTFGCTISLMSYDNQVTIVNSCYAAKCPDPSGLLESIIAEWAALRAAALVAGEGDAGAAKAAGADGAAGRHAKAKAA